MLLLFSLTLQLTRQIIVIVTLSCILHIYTSVFFVFSLNVCMLFPLSL